jgi:hypothetical protein
VANCKPGAWAGRSRAWRGAVPGLRGFGESDADRFFGREGTVRQLLARLTGHRFSGTHRGLG